MVIGEKIKYLRQMLGFTQNKFSNELGIAPNTLKGIETGKQLPGYRVIEKIATYPGLESYTIWLFNPNEPEPEGIIKQESDDPIDKIELLLNVIEMVEEVLTDNQLELPPRKKAELITYIVKQCAKDKKQEADLTNVIQLVKMTA